MTDAWEVFTASLNLWDLERERMRVVGELTDERPGSRVDREMRAAHDYIRHLAVVEARNTRADAIARLQEADADREIRARGYDTSNTIEAAIRSYSQRQHRKAA